MPNLYREESSYATINAQRNLCGRTHYVDPDTLRYHKSRVLSTHITDGGLLFALVESAAMDMNNTKRGFRYVIFDVFGTVLDRLSLGDSFKTRKAATKAMWNALNTFDARKVTTEAIASASRNHAMEMKRLALEVSKLVKDGKTGKAA